jgi:hypothetical protein
MELFGQLIHGCNDYTSIPSVCSIDFLPGTASPPQPSVVPPRRLAGSVWRECVGRKRANLRKPFRTFGVAGTHAPCALSNAA